jgi:UDP-N-acetylglucosamine--N-acetylmuramyl-(pentapeptide) pyrophosphoryl-undecaprenol N-acetylglucosamine transferase
MAAANRPIRLLLTGGGTGGHLFPGIAAAEALCSRRPGSEVLFIGTRRKIDRTSLGQYGFAVKTIHCYGIKGKNFLFLLQAALVLPFSFLEAAWQILRFKPDLVLGVGGYVTGPVVAMAKLLGKPTLIHEQNSVPGLANRKLGGLVDRVCLSIPGSEKYFPKARTILTGNPVRSRILGLAGSPDDRGARQDVVLMILGGSQGAHRVNELASEAVIRYTKSVRGGLKVIHQTGAADEQMVKERYAAAGINAQVSAFFTDMAAVYAQADLLISRAGATTLAELAVLGKPAILIPYPYAADNHQEKNGLQYVRGGGAVMLLQKDLTEEALAEAIGGLAADPEKRKTMAANMRGLAYPLAAEAIVDVCLQMVEGPGGAVQAV